MGVGKFLELLYFHLVSKLQLQLLVGFNVLLVAVLGVLGAGRLGGQVFGAGVRQQEGREEQSWE